MIIHHYRYKYNQHLRFVCHQDTKKYDAHCWYNPPACMENGSLKFVLKMLKGQRIYYLIKKNRVEGIAGRTQLNRDTIVYDYDFGSD